MSRPSSLSEQIAAVRRFNRFYTRQIGLLEEGHLHSPFSLTEVRVLYELAHRRQCTATEVGEFLGLDHGYLSRKLRGLEKQGLIRRERSKQDGRQAILQLTSKGAKVFGGLNEDANQQIGGMLQNLSDAKRQLLIRSLSSVESILGGETLPSPIVIRQHRPGDMGWVVYRHGALYKQEYGWDERFEALVAHVVADFIDQFDPKRDRCWIAEKDGEIVGSIFLVKSTTKIAKLRLFLVEPTARGSGIGKILVQECLRFAREAGYTTVRLWTQSCLDAAGHIYERVGFRLIEEEPNHSFGHDLVSQTWELKL